MLRCLWFICKKFEGLEIDCQFLDMADVTKIHINHIPSIQYAFELSNSSSYLYRNQMNASPASFLPFFKVWLAACKSPYPRCQKDWIWLVFLGGVAELWLTLVTDVAINWWANWQSPNLQTVECHWIRMPK